MYLLFRYHNIRPLEWEGMGYGERVVLKSFLRKEMTDRQKEIDSIGGGD